MNFAVITVCLDGKEKQQADLLKTQHFNQISSVHFDTYISMVKRAAMPLAAKSASGLLAIVDFDGNRGEATESVRYLKQLFGDKVYVIALSNSAKADDILSAMRAGCREYLSKPLGMQELLPIFDKVRKEVRPDVVADTRSATVLSLLGAKGGVGTTTLAVHLATYLAECHAKKVLLIDMKREMGHICVYLGIDGSGHYFQELIRNVSRLDSELLSSFVAHHASGVHVLASPDVFGASRELSQEDISQAVSFLREEYDYVIADMGSCSDGLNQTVLRDSSCIYLVSTPEIGAIRDLSRCVDIISADPLMNDKLQMVINRQNAVHAISVEQIEKAIRLPLAIKVPNSPDIVRSENLGETLSPGASTPLAFAIKQWTEKLAGPPQVRPQTNKKRRFFGELMLSALTR